MKIPSLTLRLSRRALAAVALCDERLEFCDGRHLSSRRDRAVLAATRYVVRVLDLTGPARVAIDAPSKNGSTTIAIREAVTELLKERKIECQIIATTDLLEAYGSPALRSRTELRALTQPFWSDIPTAVGRVLPFVLEAAAAELYEQTQATLDKGPP